MLNQVIVEPKIKLTPAVKVEQDFVQKEAGKTGSHTAFAAAFTTFTGAFTTFTTFTTFTAS